MKHRTDILVAAGSHYNAMELKSQRKAELLKLQNLEVNWHSLALVWSLEGNGSYDSNAVLTDNLIAACSGLVRIAKAQQPKGGA